MRRLLIYCLLVLSFKVGLLLYGSTVIASKVPITESSYLKKAKSCLQINKPDSAIIMLKRGMAILNGKEVLNLYPPIFYDAARKYHLQGNYDKSLKVCQFLDSLMVSIDDGEIDINRDILFLEGLNHYKLKNTNTSESILLQLINQPNTHDYDSIQVIAIKTLGNIELSKQLFPEALKFYSKAFKIEHSHKGYSKKLISALYQNMAIAWAGLQDRDSAQFYFLKMLQIKEEYLPANDLLLASGFLNYSNFLFSISNIPEALNYIDKAEQIYVGLYGSDVPALAPLYQNKGSYLIMLRNYDKALIYIQMAYDLSQKSNQVNEAVTNPLLLNLGVIYETMDEYSKAVDYLNRCTEAGLSIEQRIQHYRLLGMCYEGLNDDVNARKNYLLSIKASEEGLGKDHFQTAASYFRFGYFLSNAENNDGTLKYLNRSLNVYKNNFGNKNREVSNVLTTLAKFYHKNHNYRQALNYYQQALVAFLPDFNEIDYQKNPEDEQVVIDLNLANILINKAWVLNDYYQKESHDINDLKLGFETSKLAIAQMEKVRTSFGEDKSKLVITSQFAFFYDLNIAGANKLYELTHSAHYLNQAFEFAEKSKAAVLQSTLREMDALDQTFIPAQIRDIEKNLKEQWVESQNKLLEEELRPQVDSLSLAQLRNDLHEKNNAYDSLITVLEEDYPKYYNLKYNSHILSVSDVQTRLTKDEVFIEYHLADTLLYSFVINQDTALVYTVRIDEQFNRKVEDFVNRVKTPDFDDVLQKSYQLGQLGYALYKNLKLDAPEVAAHKNIIIIPDGILEYISFDALVTQQPPKASCSYKKLKYLIEQHVMAYGYSGNLFFTENTSRPGLKKILAIAPDYSKINKMNLDSSSISVGEIDKNLYPLVNAEEEVNYALQVYGGKKITGKDATEENFKSFAGDYSILHFAMHTFISDENPLASKLIFSTSTDTTQDGYLNTYEIYNLNLKADLAVLSACNTGSGKISNGEGIMSMARGFIYAGVPSIIMTLWAVEDYSSTSIIKSFYDKLKEGSNKDKALHDAKLEFLKNADQLNSHPYFWAAYVQIGNTVPIHSSLLPQGWILYLSGLIFILLIAFLIYNKRRKRH